MKKKSGRPRKLTSKLKEGEFYCVSCRKRCKGDSIKVKKIRNKKLGPIPALKSKCPKCDTNVTKFIKWDSEKDMVSKYGRR